MRSSRTIAREIAASSHVARPRGSRRAGRLRVWLRRYGPAELLGTAGAMLGAFLVGRSTGNTVAAAFGGVIGENLGFYGTMYARELLREARHAPVWTGTFRAARTLAVELGPAELLDSTVVRPLALGAGIALLGPGPGVLAGKLAADVAFYVPVLLVHELRTRAGRAS